MTDIMKDFDEFFNDLMEIADQHAAGDVVYSLKEKILEAWEQEYGL